MIRSNLSDDERLELIRENDLRGTDFYVLVKQEQALDLASGYVPNAVKAQIRAMLDWQEEDERRAARPLQRLEPVSRPVASQKKKRKAALRCP